MIGTSPTVVQTLPAVTVRHQFERVITCNGGLSLAPLTDVYIAVDMHAGRQFAAQARHAQRGGTRLVTLNRDARALRERDVDWYDEFLELGPGEPSRATWGAFRYTGPLSLEYALRHDASSLVLVGCDGYRHGGSEDYFDGQQCARRNLATTAEQRTREALAPAFQARARLWPEVPIVQYGDPAFEIDSPNWEVRRCVG